MASDEEQDGEEILSYKELKSLYENAVSENISLRESLGKMGLLSPADSRIILQMLSEAGEPSEKLKEAAKEWKFAVDKWKSITGHAALTEPEDLMIRNQEIALENIALKNHLNEARREICAWAAMVENKKRVDIARERGWDCF